MFAIDINDTDSEKNLVKLYECFNTYAKDYFTVEWNKTEELENAGSSHKSFICKIGEEKFLKFGQWSSTAQSKTPLKNFLGTEVLISLEEVAIIVT